MLEKQTLLSRLERIETTIGAIDPGGGGGIIADEIESLKKQIANASQIISTAEEPETSRINTVWFNDVTKEGEGE